MAFIEPLDFQSLFIDFFAGNIEIFYVMGLFVIILAGIKLKMNLVMGTYFIMAFTLLLNGFAYYQGAVTPLLLLISIVAIIIGVPIIMREVIRS